WKNATRSSPYFQQSSTVRPCSLLRKSTSPSAAFTSTPSSATSRRISRSFPMIRTALACSRWTGRGASGSMVTSGPSMPLPASCSFCCTPISSSRSPRARPNSSWSVESRAFASRSEKNRVGSGTSTSAPYRMGTRTGSRPRGSVRPMLRDLTGEERAAYFRGIQPIWGGGLSEDRFETFQRRLADAPEARDRYRLLGWFVEGALTAAMKSYDLQGSCAGRPLRLLGVGAVYTPPDLRRRGHARENGRRFGLARDGWTLRFQLRRLRELARARGVGEPEWGLVAEGKFGEGAAMLRFGRDSVDVLEAAWTGAAARERVLGGLR